MLRVGITGGIGSGKTALTDWLATQGIVIVDADLAARLVVEPGQPALAEIAETFGEEFLLPDGQLDRAALRHRVFAEEDQRKALEVITHPRIRDELARQMSEAGSPYVVLSSPLLLESGQWRWWMSVWWSTCPRHCKSSARWPGIRMIGSWLSRSWPRNWIGKRGLHALTW